MRTIDASERAPRTSPNVDDAEWQTYHLPPFLKKRVSVKWVLAGRAGFLLALVEFGCCRGALKRMASWVMGAGGAVKAWPVRAARRGSLEGPGGFSCRQPSWARTAGRRSWLLMMVGHSGPHHCSC